MNTDTGVHFTAKTNQAGYFSVSNLNAGKYQVDITATGFRPVTRNDVEVDIGSVVRLDFKLEVGTQSETINVEGVSPVIEFSDKLNNRVVNFVPVGDLSDVLKWCDDTTQTVGIYPEAIRARVLDLFAIAGVQRLVPLSGGDPMKVYADSHHMPPGSPHDGMEPMRRSVRWVINMRPLKQKVALGVAVK